MELDLFGKYKELKYRESNSLFEPDLLWAIKNKRCPFCFCKLYPMMRKPLYWCKSRRHKNRFVISKEKVDK